MGDVAPEGTVADVFVGSIAEFVVDRDDCYPDVHVNPEPSAEGVEAHQAEGGVQGVEVDSPRFPDIAIVWGCQGHSGVEQEQADWRHHTHRNLISLSKLLLQVDVINQPLDQENEIVVQLSHKSINLVWICTIFEVVQSNTSKDPDQLKQQSILRDIKELNEVVNREESSKHIDGRLLPFGACLPTEQRKVDVRVANEYANLSEYQLGINTLQRLLRVSPLSPIHDWVHDQAVQEQGKQEPQP